MASVLVVDDDISIKKLMHTALILIDCQDAIMASTVEDALLEIIRHKPKILILDIYLASPTITGIDMLKALRSNEMYKDLFVIIVSGADFINTEKCLKFGANIFLEKPFSPNELQTIVQTQLAIMQ